MMMIKLKTKIFFLYFWTISQIRTFWDSLADSLVCLHRDKQQRDPSHLLWRGRIYSEVEILKKKSYLRLTELGSDCHSTRFSLVCFQRIAARTIAAFAFTCACVCIKIMKQSFLHLSITPTHLASFLYFLFTHNTIALNAQTKLPSPPFPPLIERPPLRGDNLSYLRAEGHIRPATCQRLGYLRRKK